MVKQDKRTVQTKNQIVDALVQLIHSKGFNNINVTDLTRTAGIGRGTFYIHYLDKFDLLNKVEAKLLGEIKEVLNNVIPEELKTFTDREEEVPSNLVIKTLDYFYKNSKLLSALLSPSGDPYFIGKIKTMFKDLIMDSFSSVKDHTYFNPNVPKDYVMEIVLGYSMNIVVYWMSKDEPESPQKIAKIIKAAQRIAPNDLINIKG